MKNLQPLCFPDVEPRRPMLIAGPCSAETEEQVVGTARRLAAAGCRIFRAGLWKPRTKPGGFEGVGAEGIAWLQRVKRETGMYVATEVANRDHVEAALAGGVDLLWIGARTSANPFAVQEIADALQRWNFQRSNFQQSNFQRVNSTPTLLIKNPVSPDLELWIGAFERLYEAGVRRLGAIHRGFTPAEKGLYRNQPLWSVPIELRRRLPQLPLFCDPSHMGGRRDAVAPLAQQAMNLGFDGLFVEVHCTPDEAWSDREQQITPEELAEICRKLVIRETVETTASLDALRSEIDRLDDELLAVLTRRMHVAREIGQYKKEHAMPVWQAARYEELLARRVAEAEASGMAGAFMRRVLQAIHEESVRQQMEVLDKE